MSKVFVQGYGPQVPILTMLNDGAIVVEWHEGDTEAEPHAIGYRDYYRIHRHGDPVVDGQTIMDYLDYLAKRVSEL